MKRNAIQTEDAPQAIGPYSQAVTAAGWIFTAGQIGVDPIEGSLKEGIEAQTYQALRNLEAILVASGCAWKDVVKTTIYLKDMADFSAFNAVYAEIVEEPFPARSTVQAAHLPKNALVEIDAVAYVG